MRNGLECVPREQSSRRCLGADGLGLFDHKLSGDSISVVANYLSETEIIGQISDALHAYNPQS